MRSPDAAATRGRRVRRRPDVARGEILAAAARSFADHGFDGARLEKIAEQADINVSLIYHYFSNKEDLFIAVLEDAYRKMRDAEGDEAFGLDDPREAMAAFVRGRFRIFLEAPELVGLLNAENVHKARHIVRSEKIDRLYRPLVERLAALVRRGADVGVFRGDVDAEELFITVTGMGYFYLSNRHTLAVVLGTDLADPDRIARREAHMVDAVLSLLRPSPSAV